MWRYRKLTGLDRAASANQMTLRLLSAAGFLLLGGESLLRCEEPRRLQLPWNELGRRITSHTVALVLPNGTHIEGKVRDVVRRARGGG